MREKQESLLTPLHDYCLFLIKCRIINAIITTHTITSPNTTIPAAPNAATPSTVSIANTTNMMNKIVNNIIM